MFDLSRATNYSVACGFTDLHLGIDGLAAIVMTQYGLELQEGSLFLFCGRRTDRIKALYWAGGCYVLLYKRLSNRRFQWSRSEKKLRKLDRSTMPKGTTVQASQAAAGYNYCNKWFAREKKYANTNSQNRKYVHQAEDEPLPDAYWLWLKTLDPVLGRKLEDAVSYTNNQKDSLCVLVEHGDVEISNNSAEIAIRPFVVG